MGRRVQDAGRNRISNLGDPEVKRDATFVDGYTVPSAATPMGSPGTSLKAAAADHSHPATGDSGSTGMSLTSDRGDLFKDASEQWGREWAVSFDSLGAGIICTLSGLVQGAGTYYIRVGGTSGAVDGTIVATLVVTGSGGFPTTVSSVVGAPFVNPTGFGLVKLTALTPVSSSIRSLVVLLK